MANLQAKMKEIIARVKTMLENVKKIIKKYVTMVRDFWTYHISPILQKVGYFLTNNYVLRVDNHQVTLFSLIKIKITHRRRESFFGYAFIFVWLLGFIVFTLYPLFFSFYLTFNRAFFNLQTGIVSTFSGLNNYRQVLTDGTLLPLFYAYFTRILLSVPLIVVFSIIIAMLINQPIKGKGLFRTIFFLPVVISTGPVIRELFNQNATTLPSIQDARAIQFVLNNLAPFLSDPLVLLFNSMLYVLWYAGIPILIFLAGLQKIDRALFEAAAIDGASPWDTFWKITLPSLRPLISVSVIYIVVSMSLFVESGGILELARIHMEQGASDNILWKGYGYAATIAWVYFIMMVLMIVLFVGLLSIRRERKRV